MYLKSSFFYSYLLYVFGCNAVYMLIIYCFCYNAITILSSIWKIIGTLRLLSESGQRTLADHVMDTYSCLCSNKINDDIIQYHQVVVYNNNNNTPQ